jgi:hypothetical protein
MWQNRLLGDPSSRIYIKWAHLVWSVFCRNVNQMVGNNSCDVNDLVVNSDSALEQALVESITK